MESACPQGKLLRWLPYVCSGTALAARAKETADDTGAVLPICHLASRHDVPPGATPFPPEATTPHAHLTLLKGEALTTVPTTALTIAFEHWRRADERWDTSLAAFLRLTAIIDGAAFPLSSATGNDAEKPGAYYPYFGDEPEKFPPKQLSWEVLTSTIWWSGRLYGHISI
jgi:hypothetical protein